VRPINGTSVGSLKPEIIASAVPTVSVILILLPIVNPKKSAPLTYKEAPFPKFEKAKVELGGTLRVPVVTNADGWYEIDPV